MSNLAAAACALKSKPQEKSNLTSIAEAIEIKTRELLAQKERDEREKRICASVDSIKASLKAERKNQGLTQRELARRAGVSQGTVTRAESQLWVSLTRLMKIAAALGKEVKII